MSDDSALDDRYLSRENFEACVVWIFVSDSFEKNHKTHFSSDVQPHAFARERDRAGERFKRRREERERNINKKTSDARDDEAPARQKSAPFIRPSSGNVTFNSPARRRNGHGFSAVFVRLERREGERNSDGSGEEQSEKRVAGERVEL